MDHWLEYAFTSPLQIVLIASPVDHTGRLHAHVAVGSSGGLVLLVFVVERVMENVMTCSIVQQIEGSTKTSEVRTETKKNRLWWVCFFVSVFLHVLWYILIFQLSSIEQETKSYVVRWSLYSQFVLFTLFAPVPLTQQKYIRGVSSARTLYGFLSVATKFTRVYVLCVFIPIFI
jgi:hypothetical protein